METKKIVINYDEIERRAKIKPFGGVNSSMDSVTVESIAFITNNTNQAVEGRQEKETVEEFKIQSEDYKPPEIVPTPNPGVYIPPSCRKDTSVSVKISNYPLDMSREELFKILTEHSKVPFYKLHMVRDRETGSSKGYSFVTVENKEKANILIKELRDVVVDSLRLLGELAKSN